ncbi:MAG: hypothetical protein HY814_01210 [Candidatus Riflebacteria bacterium]|nr:hypothetical protein [Candidatus Riflebacteria bacterium]
MKRLMVFSLVVLFMTPALLSASEGLPDGRLPGGFEEDSKAPSLDPFKVLVPEPEPPRPPAPPPPAPGPPPPDPPRPPLAVTVTAYGLESNNPVAVLHYNGTDYLVEEGWESDDGAFTVREIDLGAGNSVTVVLYDRRAQRRQTVRWPDPDRIAGGERRSCIVRPQGPDLD